MFEVLIVLGMMEDLITVVVSSPLVTVDVLLVALRKFAIVLFKELLVVIVLVMTIVLGRVSLVMEVVKAVIILEGLLLKVPLVVVEETLTSLLLEVDTHVTCKKYLIRSGN